MKTDPFQMFKRTPVKKRRTKPRRGPLRDDGYKRFIRTLPCLMRARDGDAASCPYWYGADAAHTGKVNGMSSKSSDATCVPLCRTHHQAYDRARAGFEKLHRLDMKAIAAEYWQRYQQEREHGV